MWRGDNREGRLGFQEEVHCFLRFQAKINTERNGRSSDGAWTLLPPCLDQTHNDGGMWRFHWYQAGESPSSDTNWSALVENRSTAESSEMISSPCQEVLV